VAFVRIYSSVATDEKFATIYDNDRNFAWYVRLLVWAKGSYPAPAPIPRSMPSAALKALEQAGIIEVVNRDYYTVCGLAKEMADMPDGHRAGGLVRAATAVRGEDGKFGGSAPAASPTSDDGRVDIDTFIEIRHRAPTAPQRRVLDDILSRHDVTGPQWAADIMLANQGDPIGAVIRADREWRETRKAGAVAQEQESAERKRRGLQDPLLQEIARAMREQEATPA
jgi:hypothetical protein